MFGFGVVGVDVVGGDIWCFLLAMVVATCGLRLLIFLTLMKLL